MICEIHIYVNPEHFSLPSPSLFVCVCVSSSSAAAFMWNYKCASIFICVCALDIYGSIQCQNHNSSFTLNNPLLCTSFQNLTFCCIKILLMLHWIQSRIFISVRFAFNYFKLHYWSNWICQSFWALRCIINDSNACCSFNHWMFPFLLNIFDRMCLFRIVAQRYWRWFYSFIINMSPPLL